jgi:putative Holliday junction resolvase
MKILGLDYGSRRIGVAISDVLGMIGRGVTTLMRKNREADLDVIVKLVNREGIEKIVIGYPLRLDGSEGIQCEKINRFIGRLEMRLSLPVVRWDETLSTKEAEQFLNEGGLSSSKKRKIVDRVAASMILQGYLDAMACQKDSEAPFKDEAD